MHNILLTITVMQLAWSYKYMVLLAIKKQFITQHMRKIYRRVTKCNTRVDESREPQGAAVGLCCPFGRCTC